MPHYKTFYPSEYLQDHDLTEKGLTELEVTIEKIVREEVPGADGKRTMKPVVYFKGGKKRWPLPKTCAHEIAKKHGHQSEGWVGKKIIIYPTECMAFGEMRGCIRIK